MLKLIQSNPYNLELLVGAMQYIISSCESVSLKQGRVEGYYDEYGFFHHPAKADDRDGDSYEDVINDLLERGATNTMSLSDSPFAIFIN